MVDLRNLPPHRVRVERQNESGAWIVPDCGALTGNMCELASLVHAAARRSIDGAPYRVLIDGATVATMNPNRVR